MRARVSEEHKKEKIRQQKRRYYLRYSEKIKAKIRAYDEKNKERLVEYRKDYRLRSKDKYKNWALKRVFGISLADFNAMMERQSGVCAACKRPELRKKKGHSFSLSVDHCHKTGKIRGLLCTDCNRAIGLICDSPDTAKRIVAYLMDGGF